MVLEVASALMKTNFNFPKASELLYIHKNTLAYRYGQLKELLEIDPVTSAKDRAFLGGFYLYLTRKGEHGQEDGKKK